MPDQEIFVKVHVKTAGLAEKFRDIISSIEGFKMYSSKSMDRPDLLIFGIGENLDEEFKIIRSLLDSGQVGEVFATSGNTEPDLLLRTFRAGVKEFLPQPLKEEEVKEALASLKQRKQQRVSSVPDSVPGQIFYVMGSKGGAGATTVAVNLAVKLAEVKGTGSVALVDMHSVFGEVPLFLSLKPAYDWGEIIKNLRRLDRTFLMNVLARHSSGVHVLTSPSHLNGVPPATPEIMERLLGLMKQMFDYIVIDGGQSLQEASLKAIEMSDKVLFITLLNLLGLANTNKVMKSLSNMGLKPDDRFKIIINRFLKKSDLTLKEAEESIRTGIYWTIPNDYQKTMSAINQGKALHEIASRAPITRNIAALADSLRVDNDSGQVKKKRGLFRK